MTWQKIKHLFSPDKNHDWMWTHAANPVPWILDVEKEIIRIFFTCRNKINHSYIGYIDIDFANGFKILKISDAPVISPGSQGLFDDSGAAMGYLIEKDSELFLFYLGWNLKVTVPWLNTIGLAKADSVNGPFKKTSLAPLMDRSNEDPYSISYPSVLFDEGKYKMWYGSNLSWGADQSEMKHIIKYAESDDLINWKRTDQIHINLEQNGEYALSKPWVIKSEGGYKMWYSYRASDESLNYRIGYADSKDARTWVRKDNEAHITVSSEGWDSEMICYPSVFTLNKRTYMLYNGNGYGRTGFGIAEFK